MPRTLPGKLRPGLARAEDTFSLILIALTAVLPCIQVVARILGRPGIYGSSAYVEGLVLWTAFAAGALAAREGRHLSLTAGIPGLGDAVKARLRVAASAVSAFITTVLALASLAFALIGFAPGARAGLVPAWVPALGMPAGFAAITWRFVRRASGTRAGRWLAALGVLAGLAVGAGALADIPTPASEVLRAVAEGVGPVLRVLYLPLIGALILATVFGSPIFILLGGLAVLFFLHAGSPLETITNQAYTMLSGPIIPALPLFTLAGFIISESKAGERLVRLFQALFGWMPGGLAVMSILICAFLTTFTGASGVTILAVGALLLYVLTAGGHDGRFSSGLLTASGSIGLLFPPSLPVILYGVVAQVDIRKMFLGGILPGILMILALSGIGIFRSVRDRVPRVPFRPREAVAAVRGSALEILLPFIILFLFLGGVMTLVETAAFAVVYALAVEVIIHRDLAVRRLPEVFAKSAVVMGGVLVILCLANGLSYYIVDAEVPVRLAAWLHASVSSRYLFLALLNVALLVVGALMDVYSAITVVVPLIIPIAASYSVDPVHLGIIFLANLELGYLTPPVGLNLYLASYRFNLTVAQVVRDVVPFLLVLLASVLVITYVPWLTTWLLGVIRF